ncbi:MAG: pyridoxal phosphate-dependent aminotransferase [Candidatus Omnitrophica bacterium]|nr:pyridoxal phosphate-dependent aminotransferase [Candidatus Omnitrophota bacterium]
MKRLAQSAHHLEGQPMFRVLAKVQELERKGQDIIHFEIGDPDFASPGHAVEAAVRALRSGKTHYANSMGIVELREALREHAEREWGIRPSLDQILVVPANAIVYLVIRCVVNPGEEVIVPDPCFPTYLSAIHFIGARPVRVPLDEARDFKLDPEAVRERITDRTRLIILNSPHNPTGSVMSPGDVDTVAALAEEKDVYLLSDEVYRKVVYGGSVPRSPSVRDGCRKRTVILNSFSKSHAMSGWRLGYAIGPEEVIEKMNLLLQTIISCVPPFIQYGGIGALDPDSEERVAGMVREFQKRRDAMVHGLNGLRGVSCRTPGGAFYVFPDIRGTGFGSAEFAELMLEKAGVALLPGPHFGDHAEGYVRLCYTIPVGQIEKGIQRMHHALDEIPVSPALS